MFIYYFHGRNICYWMNFNTNSYSVVCTVVGCILFNFFDMSITPCLPDFLFSNKNHVFSTEFFISFATLSLKIIFGVFLKYSITLYVSCIIFLV